jgi:hypothetical protein
MYWAEMASESDNERDFHMKAKKPTIENFNHDDEEPTQIPYPLTD